MLLGAMIGDLAGSVPVSVLSGSGIENLFNERSHLTNSSIYMLVTAERISKNTTHDQIVKLWNNRYPERSISAYGMNNGWIISGVLPCVMKADEKKVVVHSAKLTAQVLDAGLESTIAAEAAVEALHMAVKGKDKEEIRMRLEEGYGYNLDYSISDIRRMYDARELRKESCVNVCKHALISFLEGKDYLSCIRNAVRTGGDTASIATMAGALAAVYYGLPLLMRVKAQRLLPGYRKLLLYQ